MTKTDIIRKLTSRKFWMAVALFVTGLITAFGGEKETAETVAGCIMQGAAVLGYILGEGLADASNAITVMPEVAIDGIDPAEETDE